MAEKPVFARNAEVFRLLSDILDVPQPPSTERSKSYAMRFGGKNWRATIAVTCAAPVMFRLKGDKVLRRMKESPNGGGYYNSKRAKLRLDAEHYELLKWSASPRPVTSAE